MSPHQSAGLEEPGTEESGRQRRPSRVLYTADAWCPDHPLLTDAPGLVAAARSAVATGGGHVLDEVRVVFPNRAITVVLVLAESHLSMHTWPEEGLIAIDLFSCGVIDGTVVIDGLRAAIGPRRMTVSRTVRGGV